MHRFGHFLRHLLQGQMCFVNTSQIRLQVAPQDSQNSGRDFAKRKQTDAEFAGNSLLRMVIINIAINLLLSRVRVTRHPAGMHYPSWDDAFVSSFSFFYPTEVQWQGLTTLQWYSLWFGRYPDTYVSEIIPSKATINFIDP